MAKHDKAPKPRSRVKFRFVDVEVEGDDATLIEGVRAIVASFAKGGSPGRGLARAPSTAGQLEAPDAIDDEVADSEEAVEASGVVGEDRPARPRTPARVRTPEAVTIDLISPGPSLQEFVDSFGNVDPSHPDRILVAAQWLREHRGINEFEVGHVYTCYRAVKKWTPQPRDYYQALRDMARLKSQLIVKSGDGYKITSIGENRLSTIKS